MRRDNRLAPPWALLITGGLFGFALGMIVTAIGFRYGVFA